MRIQAWGTLLALVVAIGTSGCSQTIHTAKDDDSEDLLFGYNKPTTAKKHTTTTQARYSAVSSQQIALQHQPYRPAVSTRAMGMPALSSQELLRIADHIFRNESGGDPDNLVHWNDGENFASMGLGHFTWYPAGYAARFGNTFPDLLGYLQANGVQLPGWVQQARYQGAPWRTKAELMRAKRTGQVRELQDLLYQTRLLQAAYIVERTRRAMPLLVKAAPAHSRSRVAQNLNAIANTPGGWYVLVDYVNFKGEGLNTSGGYKGQNWGLLQVLEDMYPSQPGQQSLHLFADAANRVLERRVRNSPPARNEARWLAGWSRRINTYRYANV